MTAYYNEIDPYAAQWLRNLIAAGHIAPGVVDERDIQDVRPDELRQYTQCHFFAGISVWSYALRRAGWPDDRPVWTGSCPCQPFSSAGKGAGFTDERHLWPAWHWLVEQCRPSHVFGEQVASKDGLTWLDLVQTDMEGTGYTSGAVDLCAAGVGAPHIRQRLWFVAERVADTDSLRSQQGGERSENPRHGSPLDAESSDGRLADTDAQQRQHESSEEPPGVFREAHGSAEQQLRSSDNRSSPSGLADAECDRHNRAQGDAPEQVQDREKDGLSVGGSEGLRRTGGPYEVNGFWQDADWLFCRDGKWRPVEPGTFPLADGITNRVGRLRAYGNAINAEAAETFIRATLND